MIVTEVEALSSAFGMVIAGSVVRSSTLAAASGLLMLLIRSLAPDIRHLIWRSVLYSLLLLPLLQLVVPPVRRVSRTLTQVEGIVVSGPRTGTSNVKPAEPLPSVDKHFRDGRAMPWISVASGVYALVTAALLLQLGLNLLRLKRIVRRGELVLLPEVNSEVRVSAEVRVPMAVGINRKCILLPSSWRLWSTDKLHAVLIHETAHMRRGDPATALLGSLAICLFWIHPLAYWLRRQLAALSEEACDQATLQEIRPARYAQILIEFAQDVNDNGGRLVAASTMAGGRSRMSERLEKLWSPQPPSLAGNLLTRLLLLAAFFPMLYLTAGARFDQAEPRVMSVANQVQADKFEADLLRDPNNLTERNALIAFYFNQREIALWTKHLLWLIANRPETSMAAAIIPTFGEDHAILSAAWEQALAKHSDSAEVLFHAGLFFQQQDPPRALSLFNRVKTMVDSQPEAHQRYAHAAAVIYANALTATSTFASTLRAEVENSSDPAFLSNVGTLMSTFGHTEPGLFLIQRAIDLDPANPKWKEALESAKAEPIRVRNSREMATSVVVPFALNK